MANRMVSHKRTGNCGKPRYRICRLRSGPDFNLRRIERYLTLVYNCGLNPVIILTKADLHQNPERFVTEVERVAFGVPIHLVSALDCKGLVHLEQYLSPGQTTTMVGLPVPANPPW
jgi:putative ribosome biogenesis GTPase RsgA